MAEESAISWTDATMNFWVGCEKVGPACDFCYAEAWAKRAGRPELWQGTRSKTKTWNDPLKWERQSSQFMEKFGRRRRVFTCSLADFFDNAVPDEWRTGAWDIIRNTPSLEWYIVTKRIPNVAKMLPPDWERHLFKDGPRAYGNVVIIATVINQDEVNRDVPRLMELKRQSPWLRIGLSIEPQLGPITLCRIRTEPKSEAGVYRMLNALSGAEFHNGPCGVTPIPMKRLPGLDWVIVGGESGANARYFNMGWPLSLAEECHDHAVPFHFKQIGNNRDGWPHPYTGKGDKPAEWPLALRDQQFPRMEAV